jgi:HSP20 family molecular chaperone IbpA
LPGEVKEGRIQAEFEEGVLTVNMPHRRELAAKQN